MHLPKILKKIDRVAQDIGKPPLHIPLVDFIYLLMQLYITNIFLVLCGH